ncbi:MAG: HlyC/CorC family transporter [Clostridia bacterium]|nr:HlyC/CorC family transporter [Clostridia bacterium]
MDDGSRSFLAVIIILLFLAAYFAAAETAFASASRVKLKTRLDRGDGRAKKALRVLDNFDRAITTLLIGTNIVHIVIAAMVTVFVTRNWGVTAVTVSTIITTMAVFFIGEMLPKSIAKKYSERLALSTAGSLCFFMAVFGPLAIVLTAIGKQAAKLTRGDASVSVTEDELYDIIEDMTDEGALDTERGDLVSSALQFADVTAGTVLTARVDLAAVNVDWGEEELLAFIKEQRHSRMPVYEGSIDHIVGVLQIRKYLKTYIRQGEAPQLRSLLDEAYFVHHSMKIDELLSVMSTKKLNLAIVTDNYGGTLGIVTVEDILEELVGEIWDEDDEVEEDFVPLGGGRYETDAEMTVGEVFDRLGRDIEKEAPELLYKPMGELAYEHFDRIPSERDFFRFCDMDITVSDMRQNRIVKLIVQTPYDEAKGGAAK